jgi:carboxyl-terminal processing protease
MPAARARLGSIARPVAGSKKWKRAGSTDRRTCPPGLTFVRASTRAQKRAWSIASAISGMLTGLDPHSSYMDAKSFRDMQVQTRGEFGGLGIEVTMEDGLIKVVSPIDDTPASKAGIMANDIITNLDDEAVQGLTLNQAVEKMRGPVNTKIRLKIIRKGQDNPIDVTLVRDNIRVRSVRAHVEGDDIGYIRITTFNEQTTEGLKREIGNLSTQIGDKLKGFIVDLRNNPGGLLEEAVTVSETFLARGEIVSTRGRNAGENQRRTAHAGDLTKGRPIIVLIVTGCLNFPNSFI